MLDQKAIGIGIETGQGVFFLKNTLMFPACIVHEITRKKMPEVFVAVGQLCIRKLKSCHPWTLFTELYTIHFILLFSHCIMHVVHTLYIVFSTLYSVHTSVSPDTADHHKKNLSDHWILKKNTKKCVKIMKIL